MGRLALVLGISTLIACGDNARSNDPPAIQSGSVTTAEDTPITFAVNASDVEGSAVVIEVSTPPAHGTLTMNGLQATYRPAANYHGPDSIIVTASDGESTSSATISITVTPVNDAPTAVADAFANPGDVQQTIQATTLLINDTDVDGDALTVTAVQNPQHCTAVLSGTAITVVPTAAFTGNATFDYTVSDGDKTATATVTINVGGTNNAPVATADTAATDEDATLDLDVATLLVNDSDADGQTLAIVGVTNPVNGSVSLNGTQISFVPTANFHGTASFDYGISDGFSTATATVTITVRPTNDAPVASDDVATTAEDMPLTLTSAALTGNDSDIDLDALTVTAAANPVNGTVALSGSDVIFTPAANFVGTAEFDYTVSDGALTAAAHVVVTVTAVNDAPVAGDDTATTDKLSPVTIAVLANDTDIENDPLTPTAVTQPAHGGVVISGNDIIYTPDGAFTGVDTFDYTVSDGALTDVATVSVTVNGVCGDSTVDANEQCDDGNTTGPDGCTPTCQNDRCGDGLANDPKPRTVSAASIKLLAYNCGSAANATFTINGGTPIVMARSNSCTCTPGVLTYDLTPAEIATLVDGNNSIRFQMPAGPSRAWSVLSYTINGVTKTATIFDTAGSPGADTQLANACNAGVDANSSDFTATATLTLIAIEECDDGNTASDDGCSSTCVTERCGDNIQQAGEQCDDGNTIPGDGCRDDCTVEFCGDNIVDYGTGETCDDGNNVPGDGCDACQLSCPATSGPTLISGALSCNTSQSNTGRKLSTDQVGKMYAVMRCGTAAKVTASADGGLTWTAPTDPGFAVPNATSADVAVEGGKSGTVFVAASTGTRLLFARSTDGGATWEAIQDLGPSAREEISIDSLDDEVYISVHSTSGGVDVYRNAANGAAGSWASVALAQSSAYGDVIIDKVTRHVISSTDTPDFHVRISSDGGATFAAETNPPGQAFYSDWAGSNNRLYVGGTDTPQSLWVINLTNSTTVERTNLPISTPSLTRAIDSNARGDAFIASRLSSGAIQLDRYVLANDAISSADSRTVVASGANWPAIAANACGRSVAYMYTSGTQVFAGTITYP